MVSICRSMFVPNHTSNVLHFLVCFSMNPDLIDLTEEAASRMFSRQIGFYNIYMVFLYVV